MESEDQQFDRETLYELAADVLDGVATPHQRAQLEAWLDKDPQARQAYLKYMLLHAELSLTSEQMLVESEVPKEMLSQPSAARDRSISRKRPFSYQAVSALLALSASIVLAVLVYGVTSQLALDQVLPLATQSYYDHREQTRAVIATSKDPNLGLPGQLSEQIRPLMTSTIWQTDGESEVAFKGGADVRLHGPTVFGLESPDMGVLLAGAISARQSNPSSQFTVQTSHIRVVDKGAEFHVHIDDQGATEVQSSAGEVEIQTQVRLPRYYWNFESPTPLRDLVHGEEIQLGSSAKHVSGLIGDGALAFDNSYHSYGQVLGGTGPQVGTGRFAVTHGISIEVVCTSKWSGEWQDYDEIFRKEDGDCRILLSFQLDDFDYSVPEIPTGPCLSFGLNLADKGYDELDMPLDGKNGRPTVEEMTDGRPHHIVATYDFFTGRKSIYIDGRLRFEHVYPKGMLILSGGPAPARIGNLHRSGDVQGIEPYHGVIDEVAYYDFALTPEEIAAHYERVSQGKDYFGIPASEFQKERWVPMAIVAEGESRLFQPIRAQGVQKDS
ncbi:LamG-like jellyroll fold domain-containing protein [Bremerella alba]|uniref:FecR protein n=1 Tax=Bremerella alba TaxID=980252 RepID=A0A7V8VAA1_9BACT|nr:LamG-like jellyroll fold domain-containing protein [Bremerella alba]MBA2117837.1 hypothetical protein [Bremerella alba]